MLGWVSGLVALGLTVAGPPVQRPKSMTQPGTPAPIVPPSDAPIDAPPDAPTDAPVQPDAPAIEPPPASITPPVVQPRAPGSPPVLPPEPGATTDPSAPIEPAPASDDPFAPSPPPQPSATPTPPTPPPPMVPGDPSARRTVDPFTDARPADAPTRDGKALLYGGLAFSAITVAVRVPVSLRLVRVGDPYDAMVFGNVVNLVGIGAVTTLILGAVRRGRYVAYEDAFEHGKRRHNAKAYAATGWTMFGVGMTAFVLSRVFTPLTCDLVNQCDFRGLEATWYLSFGLIAAGAAVGTFGAVYGDRSRSYEQRGKLTVMPWLDRSRAGVGLAGRF